jgi:hypothetical protein
VAIDTGVLKKDTGKATPNKAKLEDLEERLNKLDEYYSGLNSRWVEDEQYYRCTFPVRLPPGVVATYCTTGQAAVDTSAVKIVTDKPLVRRRRPGGLQGKGKDDEVEAWLKALIEEVEQLTVWTPFRDMVRMQLGYGGGYFLGPFFNRERWDEKKDRWIWYEVIAPQLVRCEPGPEPTEAFIVQEMTVSQIQQKAKTDKLFQGLEVGDRDSLSSVKIVRWFGFADGKDTICSMASWERGTEDFMAKPQTSGYPYLPVEPVISGMGLPDPEGKAENLFISIYTAPIKSLLHDETKAFTMVSATAGMDTWERYQSEDDEAIKATQISYEPGSISYIPANVRRMDRPTQSQAVLEHLRNVRAELRATLLPEVLQGTRPAGVDTASGLAILAGQGAARFGPIITSLEKGAGRLMRKVGMLIDQLSRVEGQGAKFTIRGRTVTAKAWENDFGVSMGLLAEDPEDKNARLARGAVLRGDLSKRYRGENYYGVENWAEEWKQQIVEAIVEGPVFKRTLEKANQLLVEQEQEMADEAALSAARGTPEGQAVGEGHGPMQELEMVGKLAEAWRAQRIGQDQMPAPEGSPEQMGAQMRSVVRAGQPAGLRP